MNWWADELMIWWADELMSWWTDELMNWWADKLMSWLTDELTSWWTDELMSLWTYYLQLSFRRVLHMDQLHRMKGFRIPVSDKPVRVVFRFCKNIFQKNLFLSRLYIFGYSSVPANMDLWIVIWFTMTFLIGLLLEKHSK